MESGRQPRFLITHSDKKRKKHPIWTPSPDVVAERTDFIIPKTKGTASQSLSPHDLRLGGSRPSTGSSISGVANNWSRSSSPNLVNFVTIFEGFHRGCVDHRRGQVDSLLSDRDRTSVRRYLRTRRRLRRLLRW